MPAATPAPEAAPLRAARLGHEALTDLLQDLLDTQAALLAEQARQLGRLNHVEAMLLRLGYGHRRRPPEGDEP